MTTLLMGAGLFLIVLTQANAEVSDSSAVRMMNDIETLSRPEFQGRQAGTPGGHQSALFVARRFETLGLTPLQPPISEKLLQEWFQHQPLRANHILEPTSLNLSIAQSAQEGKIPAFQVGTDFLPILDSPSVNMTAPVTFVGYGIFDPARHHDDYQGLNVQNRIVMFLRGKPPTYKRWVTHEEKARMAKAKGANGYITVTGPLLNKYEARKGLGQKPLAIYAASPDYRPLPGVWLDGKAANSVLQSLGTTLEALQTSANKTAPSGRRELSLLASLHWDSQSQPGTLTNVLGVIPGSHPTLKEETIILGAHRDHFGKQAGLVFTGADDNASGIAVMLEIARRLSETNPSLKRTVLFIAFDGEERGLLGSQHYVNDPIRSLDKTIAMINLDHVGVGNGSFTVGVTRLDKTIVQQATQREHLSKRINLYGYFPGGDHVPFYQAGIPTVTIVSAGVHPHFHQPSDTSGTIDPAVVQTASRLVMGILKSLANTE